MDKEQGGGPITPIKNIGDNFRVIVCEDNESKLLERIRVLWKSDDSEEESEKNDEAGDLAQSFGHLSHSWFMACLGFIDAFPLFSAVAHFVNHDTTDCEIKKLLEKESIRKTVEDSEDNKLTKSTYTVGREHSYEVTRRIRAKHQFDRAEDAFARAQLLAIISEYEAFIVDLLRIIIQKIPEAFISDDATLPISTILKNENISEIKKIIVEDKILDYMRDSHVTQIKGIYGKLKLNPPDDQALREFGEICLRRNVMTHANGVANKVYLSEMKKLGFAADKLPREGEKLIINTNYLMRSTARVFQMGYFTLHIVWQHLERDQRDDSIKMIINHSHDFLVSKYTKLAGRLCEFMLNKKSPANELDRAYALINLALSYFLNDDIEEKERKAQVEKGAFEARLEYR